MKRLYLQFYLTIVATLVILVAVAGALWRFAADVAPIREVFAISGELAAGALAPADASPEVQQETLAHFARRLRIDLALFSAARAPIAAFGRRLPPPPPYGDIGGWIYGPGGPAWSLRLPDGRWLVARMPAGHRHPGLALVAFIGGIALSVGLGALPVVRRLTRRLERLQVGVESLGAGDLGARVKIEGRDEVARLAESFNRAAGRIEGLVDAHKMLLANASHELRTPLARIRLGIELMPGDSDGKRKEELARDIAELDQLVDEILLASRLDALGALEATEDVDLLALAAEECARYEQCTLDGEPASLTGDPRLLRRMIRNLLENAQRHGEPPVTVTVRRGAAGLTLTVCDAGPGIPAAERGELFAPFHRMAGAATGTGLGLALVRQIARQHGGEASYDASDGASCFRVTLPATQATAQKPRP